MNKNLVLIVLGFLLLNIAAWLVVDRRNRYQLSLLVRFIHGELITRENGPEVADHLDLEGQPRQKFMTVLDKFAEKEEPHRSRVPRLMARMRQELYRADFREKEIRGLIKDISETKSELIYLMVKKRTELAGTLDEKQAKQMREYLEDIYQDFLKLVVRK